MQPKSLRNPESLLLRVYIYVNLPSKIGQNGTVAMKLRDSLRIYVVG